MNPPGMNAPFPADMRLLLAHKQKTSARVRFLRFPHGLCAFEALPKLSTVYEDPPSAQVEMHPSLYLRSAEAALGLDNGGWRWKPNSAPASIRRMDRSASDWPPLPQSIRRSKSPRRFGGRFIAITEARGGSPAEMELLRQAYTALMG
jgi:hypothetical protein